MLDGIEGVRFENTFDVSRDLSCKTLTVIARVFRSSAFHGGLVAVTERTEYVSGGSTTNHEFYYLQDWVRRTRDLITVGGHYTRLACFAGEVEHKCSFARASNTALPSEVTV
jgi:hypothetical protein